MRNTRQKSLILDIIHRSFCHPTAYMVYEECRNELPNISLGTVYRNLSTLVELGKIQRLMVPGGMDRYDKLDVHDHFICLRCGDIIDIARENILYDSMLQGNLVMNCKICYEGICSGCLELEKKGDDIDGIKGK